MRAYHNENDPYSAQWLRNLIAKGLIPHGDVDTRSIRDVSAADLEGYTACHFFAGMGGWPLALQLAGWPDDRVVWTGSCPCQPFSKAGGGGGFTDERHLWPSWHWLIEQHRPDVIFGEQVESPIGLVWLDLVCSDLEAGGYAVGAVVFPAAGVGAPNIRHRLFWVAHADRPGRQGVAVEHGPAERRSHPEAERDRAPGGGLGHAGPPRLPDAEPASLRGTLGQQEGRAPEQPGGPRAPWRVLQWLDCTDGRQRPTQPGVFPLAARLPGDVGRLRATGDAINAVAAAEVIRAFMETGDTLQ